MLTAIEKLQLRKEVGSKRKDEYNVGHIPPYQKGRLQKKKAVFILKSHGKVRDETQVRNLQRVEDRN